MSPNGARVGTHERCVLTQAVRVRNVHRRSRLPRLAEPIRPLRLEPEPFAFGPRDRLAEWAVVLLVVALVMLAWLASGK